VICAFLFYGPPPITSGSSVRQTSSLQSAFNVLPVKSRVKSKVAPIPQNPSGPQAATKQYIKVGSSVLHFSLAARSFLSFNSPLCFAGRFTGNFAATELRLLKEINSVIFLWLRPVRTNASAIRSHFQFHF
jgi:hypothetical protein